MSSSFSSSSSRRHYYYYLKHLLRSHGSAALGVSAATAAVALCVVVTTTDDAMEEGHHNTPNDKHDTENAASVLSSTPTSNYAPYNDDKGRPSSPLLVQLPLPLPLQLQRLRLLQSQQLLQLQQSPFFFFSMPSHDSRNHNNFLPIINYNNLDKNVCLCESSSMLSGSSASASPSSTPPPTPRISSKSAAAADKRSTTTRNHPHNHNNNHNNNHNKRTNTKSSSSSATAETMLRRIQTMRRIEQSTARGYTLESKYKIKQSVLGEGSFGAVYLAESIDTGELVALKRIPKDRTDDDTFRNEMNAMLRIRAAGGHPHICALRESFDEGDDYCLVLELILGGEMFEHLINHGAYSEADAARLVREVASALAFLHGIGVIHADLKPENIMLSSQLSSDAAVKLVDFGCSRVVDDNDINHDDDDDEVELFDDVGADEYNFDEYSRWEKLLMESDKNSQSRHLQQQQQQQQQQHHDDDPDETPPVSSNTGYTPAYSPPEAFEEDATAQPSNDMWSLGIILYIMLIGVHPFDPTGKATDDEIKALVSDNNVVPPIRNCRFTKHLSEGALDILEQLIHRDPNHRLTAEQMLSHPWVTGETARKDKIAGSDTRLGWYRKYKSKLLEDFFRGAVEGSDDVNDETRRRRTLIEQSFRSLDKKNRGSLTPEDLAEHHDGSSDDEVEGGDNIDYEQEANTDESSGGKALSMTDFEKLLSENMKSRYFPKGHVIYRQGEEGHHMYFINSGVVHISTNDGSRAIRKQNDFFGEGALLHPEQKRSATIKCKTPVHAFEISREDFEGYLANTTLHLNLREKDKIRKKNRMKTILRVQNNLQPVTAQQGEFLYKEGEVSDELYIVEKGNVDVTVAGERVFTSLPGNLCGEYAVITGRRRNSSAYCASPDGCQLAKMAGVDLRKLMESSSDVKASLKDLCLRRDFKKAVVFRLKKEFPYDDPREAFNAVRGKESDGDIITREALTSLMRELDPDYPDHDIAELIKAIDLTETGTVTFDKFKKVFIANIKTSASI